MPSTIRRTPQTRVFTIEDTAGPNNAPEYQGLGRAMAVSWPQGDVTPVEVPSADKYDDFDTVDEIVGSRGLPTLPLQFRMSQTLSDMLRLVRKGCPIDIQVHEGVCQQPQDFDGGYDIVKVLEIARATEYGTTELGALESGDNAVITEDVPWTGRDYYEIVPLVAQSLAEAEVTDEVIDVAICDSKTCGECGVPSDGCQIMFALTGATAGSPGLPAELLFSENGGDTWSSTAISTLPLATAPSAMACVGINLVVISAADDSIHYAPIADILDGTETWTEVTTGIVAAGSPNAIFSLGRTLTWIAGDGGYIYFSDDITAGVTVQTDGSVTTEDLTSIHGLNRDRLAAVGANNALIVTDSGGETWASVTGPSVGIVLNVVSFRPGASEDEFFIGDAAGVLNYTLDGGQSWTVKSLPGTSTTVRDISWSTHSIGYLSSDIAGPLGRILRTINGGHTWVVVPEKPGLTFPANDRVTALDACVDNPNLVLGGGLGDDASDGFLVRAAA